LVSEKKMLYCHSFANLLHNMSPEKTKTSKEIGNGQINNKLLTYADDVKILSEKRNTIKKIAEAQL
jgi:hypothetical protein